MTSARDVLHAPAQVGTVACTQFVERRARPRWQVGIQVGCDQLHLRAVQPICGAVGLEESDEEEIGMPPVEDVQLEIAYLSGAVQLYTYNL